MEAPLSKGHTQGKELPVSNSRITHDCLFCKKCNSKYSVNLQCNCSQGYSTPAKTIKSSRSTDTFYNQLSKNNKGLVGPEYNNRVQDRIHLRAPSTPKTLPKPIKSEPARAGIPRDHRDDLKRGGDRATDPIRGRIFSTLFLVPKKDGGQRQVINLKSLNSFIHAPHFKMEAIHKLKSLLKKGDWLVKIDLKDAYFSIPKSQQHRSFFASNSNTSSTNSTVSHLAWCQPHGSLARP